MKTTVKYPNQGRKKRFRDVYSMTLNPEWYYAAKIASKRSGMSVGVWLESTIPNPSAAAQKAASDQAYESMKNWLDMDGNPI